jgi:hypothetical protein
MSASPTTYAPSGLTAAANAAAAVDVWTRQDAVRVYGAGHVRAQLLAHRWATPLPHIVVAHNGPMSDQQRMWVALLGAPPGALLHGLSAAMWDGLRGLTPDGLSLVIPGSSRNPAQAQLELPDDWKVEVRWSRMLGPEDVSALAVPPRTRMPRSIVDAASEKVSPLRSRVIVLAAVQQRLVTTAALWDALSRRGRCRHRALIVESIRDASGGIESLPEREFELLRRRRGLPAPSRQSVLRRVDGRYYLDNDWPEFGIRAEVHGIPHSEVRNWDHDLLRQNDITIGGGGLLIFSSYAIRHLDRVVGDQLVRLFATRGYHPKDTTLR